MAGQERFKEINNILNKELEEKKTLISAPIFRLIVYAAMVFSTILPPQVPL